MKSSTLLMLATLFSGAAFAADAPRGTIEIVGHGEAASAPQFARLSVQVTSICYNTSKEAKDANAVLAQTLIQSLNKAKRSERDKVTAAGGANTRQTEYLDAEDGTSRRKVLCDRKWRASNTLALETASMDMLPELQDELLAAIDKSDGVSPDKISQTYAQLGQPGFSVYTETLLKLRKDAEGKAWDDAKSQFEGFSSRCGFKDARVTSISQPSYNVVPKFAADVSHSTPLIPDEVSVQAVWKFVWSFEPTVGCAF